MEQYQKILIKGMLCQRCISTVTDALLDFGLALKEVTLGEATFVSTSKTFDLSEIDARLKKFGFALVENKVKGLMDAVKYWVTEVYSGDFDFPERFRFSKLIASKLLKDYDSISAVFASLENQTLENYIINYRVARAKELLTHGESLSSISFKLGYSSVAHLSRQFKAVAGINPSEYKLIFGGVYAEHAA